MTEKKDETQRSLEELRAEVRELKAFVKALYSIVIETGIGFEEDVPEEGIPGLHVVFNDEDFSM